MMYRSNCVVAALLLMTSGSSLASGNLVDQIERCTHIDGSDARLSCFDEMAKSVVSSLKNVEAPLQPQQPIPEAAAVAAVAQEPAAVVPPKPTAEDKFGFEQKQAAVAEKEVDRLYVQVSSIKKDRAGLLTIYLANEQVWKQTGTERYFYKEVQGKAYLERGSMSSFFFSQDGTKRRIRVKRLR